MLSSSGFLRGIWRDLWSKASLRAAVELKFIGALLASAVVALLTSICAFCLDYPLRDGTHYASTAISPDFRRKPSPASKQVARQTFHFADSVKCFRPLASTYVSADVPEAVQIALSDA